jgi:hypothetical protein
MVVTKKQPKFGSATEELVLPPKTNDKNCIGTMNFISGLPWPPLRIPSPPIRWAEKGHASADRRDVMPGRMGGEEKVKARGEDKRVNHETAPTIKQG